MVEIKVWPNWLKEKITWSCSFELASDGLLGLQVVNYTPASHQCMYIILYVASQANKYKSQKVYGLN